MFYTYIQKVFKENYTTVPGKRDENAFNPKLNRHGFRPNLNSRM